MSARGGELIVEQDGNNHPHGWDVHDSSLVQLVPDSTANITAATWEHASLRPTPQEQ